jgi:hypothetical protein
MDREVASPVAKQVQLAAGAAGNPFARLFRSQGVVVKPNQENATIVVGGPSGVGTHGGTLRKIVHGAEFGGGHAKTLYWRKGHRVKRSTTVGFGPRSTDGRFVFPTVRREIPRMQAAFVVIVARAADRMKSYG